MPEVVRDPGSQQLRERDGAELRVLALERQLVRRQRPRAQRFELCRAKPRELIKQLRQRTALASAVLREPVVGLEAAVVALGEDHARARDPVDELAVDQMADVVEGAEGAGA